jgi:hypothetical protein
MRRLTKEQFIDQAISVHGNKYDYSNVVYVSNKVKVEIICQKHGPFCQQPSNHIVNKQGCRYCAESIVLSHNKLQSSTSEEFIKKSKLLHGEKYDYSLVEYINKKTKVKIICSKHGVFEQRPMHHLRKCGCPKCHESKGEKIIEQVLNENKVEFEKQKNFKNCKFKNKLPFDFYLPKYNLCIEYDGEQHFKPIKIFGGKNRFLKQQKTDTFKNVFCEKEKIILVRISFRDNIKQKMLFLIKELIQNMGY